jgi:hypothetical protein
MTAKSDFEEAEWNLLLEAPMIAGMIVITASGGGTFRETFALAKAFAEARQAHGQSELLDEIVSTRPKYDRHEFGSPQELHDQGLAKIGEAVAVLRSKAPDELEGYAKFVLAAAEKAAAAHKEDGQAVSPGEQTALDEIRARLV